MDVHDSVEVPPFVIVLGEPLKVSVGTGAAVTFTVVDVVAVPLTFEQLSVYVVVVAGNTVSVPEIL